MILRNVVLVGSTGNLRVHKVLDSVSISVVYVILNSIVVVPHSTFGRITFEGRDLLGSCGMRIVLHQIT